MDNPVIAEVARQDKSSVVAIKSHPIHAMAVAFPITLVLSTLAADLFYWWTADPFWARAALGAGGGAFWLGLFAGVTGTLELLLVRGIRNRTASWSHGVAAMMLLAVAGLNWGLRLHGPEEAIMPLGLFLSALATVYVGLAGWHGGKLVFDYGMGMSISNKS